MPTVTQQLNSNSHLFINKNLEKQRFDYLDLTTSAPIHKHADWIIRNIYYTPYQFGRIDGIARYYHGGQHVSRAAIYVVAFTNLYRKYNDKVALRLTARDLKLLQITALFHDSGREGEGEDLWDNDSASLCYLYLIKIGVAQTKASVLAEAIANKDMQKVYLELQIDSSGGIKWIKTKAPRKKNIYQKIIHDADCLDIIRARSVFDATYLDFYHDFAKHNENAKNIMARLIVDARSLITDQGDKPFLTNSNIKKRYEYADNCYTKTLKDVYTKKLLPLLYNSGHLADKQTLEAINHNPLTLIRTLQDKLDSNKHVILLRGGMFPGIHHHKYQEKEENLVERELRKMSRRRGVATTSTKADRKQKHGNPFRSTSLAYPGASVYGGAGGIIIDPNWRDIKAIETKDFDSGYYKKTIFKKIKTLPTLDTNEKKSKLLNLRDKLKLGGDNYLGSNHSEILMTITEFHAIYYCNEPTILSQICNFHVFIEPTPKPYHKLTNILEAIFIQKEYERKFNISLPIYEYSANHATLQLKTFDKHQLLQMWMEITKDYMAKQIKFAGKKGNNIMQMSLDDIKVLAMYGAKNQDSDFPLSLCSHYIPADSNYPPELVTKIDNKIQKIRTEIYKQLETKILADVSCSNKCIYDNEIYYVLTHYPKLLKNFKTIVIDEASRILEIKHEISCDTCDEFSLFDILYKINSDYSKRYNLAKLLGNVTFLESVQKHLLNMLSAINKVIRTFNKCESLIMNYFKAIELIGLQADCKKEALELIREKFYSSDDISTLIRSAVEFSSLYDLPQSLINDIISKVVNLSLTQKFFSHPRFEEFILLAPKHLLNTIKPLIENILIVKGERILDTSEQDLHFINLVKKMKLLDNISFFERYVKQFTNPIGLFNYLLDENYNENQLRCMFKNLFKRPNNTIFLSMFAEVINKLIRTEANGNPVAFVWPDTQKEVQSSSLCQAFLTKKLTIKELAKITPDELKHQNTLLILLQKNFYNQLDTEMNRLKKYKAHAKVMQLQKFKNEIKQYVFDNIDIKKDYELLESINTKLLVLNEKNSINKEPNKFRALGGYAVGYLGKFFGWRSKSECENSRYTHTWVAIEQIRTKLKSYANELRAGKSIHVVATVNEKTYSYLQ